MSTLNEDLSKKQATLETELKAIESEADRVKKLIKLVKRMMKEAEELEKGIPTDNLEGDEIDDQN